MTQGLYEGSWWLQYRMLNILETTRLYIVTLWIHQSIGYFTKLFTQIVYYMWRIHN